MKLKNLIARLRASFARKPNGADKAELITNGPQVLVDGREIHGWGVQFGRHRLANLERYAIVLEKAGDTRAGVARKLRLLADAIESGKGAVRGENPLTGHELNRTEYPAVDEAATKAKYPPDYLARKA